MCELIFHLSILFLLRHFSATIAVAPPPAPTSCSDELVTFSPCLAFISASPNNISDFPPPQCCDDLSRAFASRATVCLCYFVQRPDMFGFPLNFTKFVSLTSVCAIKNRGSKSKVSLQIICSGSLALPPLNSMKGLPVDPRPRRPDPESPPPPPLMSTPEESDNSTFAPEPADYSPTEATQPDFSTTSPRTSSAKGVAQHLYCLLPASLTYIVHLLSYM